MRMKKVVVGSLLLLFASGGAAFAEETFDDKLTVTISPVEVGSVPKGATRVPFLDLTFAASCDKDVTLTDIEVKHAGLGRSSDIKGVYLVSGYRRISRSVSFDTNSQRTTLRLRRIVIPKCDAVSMRLLADISADADASGEHVISVPDALSIRSSAAYVDMRSSEPSVVVQTKPYVTGAIEVHMLPVTKRPRYGTLARVARIQLESDNKSAHKISSITLTNHGTARNLDLIRAYVTDSRGNRLSDVAHRMDERTITFVFDPRYVLPHGTTTVLNVIGEIRGSYSKTFQFNVDEEGDIVAEPVRRL